MSIEKKSKEISELVKFRIKVGVLFSAISFLMISNILLINILFIKSSYSFFRHQKNFVFKEMEIVFEEYLYTVFFDHIIWILLFCVGIFFIGYYLSIIITRPIQNIAKDCQKRIEFKNYNYRNEVISNLPLLKSISNYFFSEVDQGYEKGKLVVKEIPESFKKIHQPQIEIGFFINYSFVIIIIMIVSTYFMFHFNHQLRDSIVFLYQKLSLNSFQSTNFLADQFKISDYHLYYLAVVNLLTNIIVAIYLYSKISVPAFAIFATMRSFIKGNYYNRIHLVGYYYFRDDCRMINKYLEKVQKDLT